MPYKRAYLWVLLLFPLTGLAFWPSYFGRLNSVPWVLHAHGMASSLWVALLAVQSWSIHRGGRAIHRLAGRASLFLFPFFWASGLLIIQFMAAGFVKNDGPFHALYGARLTPVDLLTSVGVLYLYHVAVANRRHVLVHASAMLGILLFLLPPIFVRLFQIGGPLAIRGPADFPKFGYGLELSNVVSILIALRIYSLRPREAWPFLFAAAVVVVQSVAFETLGRTAGWGRLMPVIATAPTGASLVAGLILAGVVVWWSWTHEYRRAPAKKVGTVPAAA